jgi:hypothetical protein
MSRGDGCEEFFATSVAKVLLWLHHGAASIAEHKLSLGLHPTPACFPKDEEDIADHSLGMHRIV